MTKTIRASFLVAFLLIFLGARGLAIADPVFVQSAYQDPQTPQTSVTVTFPAAQTAHDLNVIVVGWEDTTAGTPSVAESKLKSYSLTGWPTTTTRFFQNIFYAKDILPSNNKVKVTFN